MAVSSDDGEGTSIGTEQVVHWNEHAEKAGLPRLVRYDASVLEGRRNDGINVAMGSNNQTRTTSIVACFNTSSNLYAGLDEKLLRNPNTNIRRVNIWDEIGKLVDILIVGDHLLLLLDKNNKRVRMLMVMHLRISLLTGDRKGARMEG